VPRLTLSQTHCSCISHGAPHCQQCSEWSTMWSVAGQGPTGASGSACQAQPAAGSQAAKSRAASALAACWCRNAQSSIARRCRRRCRARFRHDAWHQPCSCAPAQRRPQASTPGQSALDFSQPKARRFLDAPDAQQRSNPTPCTTRAAMWDPCMSSPHTYAQDYSLPRPRSRPPNLWKHMRGPGLARTAMTACSANVRASAPGSSEGAGSPSASQTIAGPSCQACAPAAAPLPAPEPPPVLADMENMWQHRRACMSG